MERKERIEIVKNKLLPAFESMFWKGNKNHPEKLEMVEALSSAIAEAELMERVSGGVEKKEHLSWCSWQDIFQGKSSPCNCGAQYFNEARDLCNAHWVSKLDVDKLLDVICSVKKNWDGDQDIKGIAQALTTYLMEEK